jgi:hypothetical protein
VVQYTTSGSATAKAQSAIPPAPRKENQMQTDSDIYASICKCTQCSNQDSISFCDVHAKLLLAEQAREFANVQYREGNMSWPAYIDHVVNENKFRAILELKLI